MMMTEEIIELEDVTDKHSNPKKTPSNPRAETEENRTAIGKKRLHDNESLSPQNVDAAEEKQRKEKRVDEMMESVDINKVKLVKPNMLKGQSTNSLEKAMKYSFNVRQRAEVFPLYEAELKAIGNSMEEYACHLIEPLKNDRDRIVVFEGKDFHRIAEKAVLLKQKKFLAHPVVYDLQERRWAGCFHWKSTTPFDKAHFKWFFLNLWILFDVLLFPVFYIVLYLIYKTSRRGSYRRHAFEMYHKYFTTPYFIFVRDTLSYFVLLGLHFAICIQPATLEFTAVEWVIVFFFLGRFMMEVYQAAIGLEDGKEIIEDDVTKRLREKLSRIFNKYLSDQWNILDASTLIVYVVLLILRVVARSAYSSVLNNRLLAVAGYLYGLNSMLLTLRLFGHLMELKRSTGTIQIALFQIIGAVLAVFGQFLAVLVAFSLAITKIRMTEVSFTGNTTTSSIQGSCFNEQGQISCWWKITRHLIWSLLVEPELLQLSDETSNALTQFLYGLFLIMAVVMLMNMMIALLTNTYQQVEDNAFYEWSYKKAATIKTYCNYHAVPVPFNVISLTFILLRYVYKKLCCTRFLAANADSDAEKERRRHRALEKTSFNQLIADLESEYYAVHGDEFPITGDRLDHVVKQTEENHQLIGHIAERLFTYGYSKSQGDGSDSNQHRYKHVPQERQRMDHSIILFKQIMDQLSELNKNYCDIKKEMDTLRKEIQTKSENEVSAL